MKLLVLVLCVFAVCQAATSRLKALQYPEIANEEQVITNIPGSSYELNTVAAEEEPLAEEPAQAAGNVEIQPVYVEAQPTAVEEPVQAAGNVEIEPVYVEAQPTAVEEPTPVAQNYEIEPVYVEAQPIAVEEPVYQAQPVAIEEPTPLYAAPLNNEELVLEAAPDTEVYYTTAAPVAELEPVYAEAVNNEELTIAEPEYMASTSAEPLEEVAYETPVVIEEPVLVRYEDESEITGGYSDVPVSRFDSDEELQNAARVCIAAVLGAARKDGKLKTDADFEIRTINSIQSQVVAGANYKFDVILGTDADADARIYATFTAFSQSWTNTLACTEGCVKIGRIVKV